MDQLAKLHASSNKGKYFSPESFVAILKVTTSKAVSDYISLSKLHTKLARLQACMLLPIKLMCCVKGKLDLADREANILPSHNLINST